MAIVYQYTDTYIVNSVDIADLELAETKALADLEKQGVTDTFYLEEMCKALVYIDLSIKQAEAEGMSARTSAYRKEYDRYNKMQLSGNGSDETIQSAEIGRG